MSGYLEWSFKLSLLMYVTTAPGGGIQADGVTSEQGQFRFPVESANGSELFFSGSVALKAHYGMPLTTFASLHLHQSTGGAWMLAMSPDDGPRVDAFELGGLTEQDGVLTFDTVTLTAIGSEMFGDYYAAGEAFDPIAIHRSDS